MGKGRGTAVLRGVLVTEAAAGLLLTLTAVVVVGNLSVGDGEEEQVLATLVVVGALVWGGLLLAAAWLLPAVRARWAAVAGQLPLVAAVLAVRGAGSPAALLALAAVGVLAALVLLVRLERAPR